VAAALAAQAAAAKAAPTDAMRLEMATLQNQVQSLESQLDEDRRNSAREISAFATQLQSTRETNRLLTDANRALLQTRGAEESAIKAELDQAKGRLQAVQAEVEKLRTDHGRLAGELESRGRELESARAAAHAENAASQAKHAETLKAVEQQGASVAELTGLNARLSAEKSGLEQQLEQTRQSAATALGDLNSLKARLAAIDKNTREQQSTIGTLGATNLSLQEQTRELGAQLIALRAENTRLAAEGEEAARVRGEMADLKTRLAGEQKAAEQQGASVAELTGANEKLADELRTVQGQLAAMRVDNERLAQGAAARQEAEQRAASLAAATAQRDLASARGEVGQLNATLQALERDRTARIAQLQQDNAALAARLRQAQGTLDQIASAAQLINSGSAATGSPIQSSSMSLRHVWSPAPRNVR